MTASPMAKTTEQSDECACPQVARRDRLDGVDLAELRLRAARLRFPTPIHVIGAETPDSSPAPA